MIIGIVGGTGEIGEGMALRLSHRHEVVIGSRDSARACTASDCTLETLNEHGIEGRCCGGSNQNAVDRADIVVLSLQYPHLVSTLSSLTGFENKIVISPVNPIARTDSSFHYNPPEDGSAACAIKRMLPKSARVVAAFNNIAAKRWKVLNEELDYAVAVCSDDQEAKETVMSLVGEISHLRAYDAGPLSASSMVESITPLLLNIARFNKMKDVGIHFV